MKTKNFILTTIICLLGSIAHTQDVIKQKNGETIEAKIIELSDDEVKFYYLDDPNKVIVTLNRSLIREIIFEYGRKEVEINPGFDESYYLDDKRNNLLINASAVASNSTIISYELATSPTSSIGAGVKLHGVGANTSYYWDEKSGFGVELNYKVKTGSVIKKNDYRPKQLLQGFYLRPDIGYTQVNLKNNEQAWNTEELDYSYFYGGFDLGNQFVFNNRLSLDVYTGINFFGGNIEKKYNSELYNYYSEIYDGNMKGSGNVAYRYGLQIGFLF